MKTTTPNYVKWLRIAFLVLTLLSLAELFGAVVTDIPYFWGYSFVVVFSFIVIVYAVLGRPYFKMDSTTKIIEFENGFSMFDFLDKYLIVSKDMLREIKVVEGMFKRQLIVYYEENGEVKQICFEISFLSEMQVNEILNDLQKAIHLNSRYASTTA